MVNRVFIGERVHRIKMRCFLGDVDGEVRNSSMSREAVENPKPL
jgi:hypothetical protein